MRTTRTPDSGCLTPSPGTPSCALRQYSESSLPSNTWSFVVSTSTPRVWSWKSVLGSEASGFEELEERNKAIFRGHLLKESFAGILDRRQINVARDMLDQWIADAKESGLDHFARAAHTIERHEEGILEYVRTRFSNGRTEGINGKIRTITRRAFGFHSAAALIAMIFLCCGGVHVTPAFSAPSGFH